MIHEPEPGRGTDGVQRTAAQELSLFDVIGLVRRHARLIVGLPLVLAFLVGVYTVLQPRVYVSDASFMPQTGDADRSRLTGLAAQFGLAVPGMRQGSSSAFYVGVARSRSILGPVAEAEYRYRAGDDSVQGTLLDLLGPRRAAPASRRAATIARLRGAVDLSTNLETGFVRMSVRAPAAELARMVAENVLERLSAFDLDRRRAQAASERVFIEQRLSELGAELRRAEERLEAFLRRNRDFRNSPELSFENDRLSRDVAMRQQIYTSFAQAYEEARVDEARNTPVLTIIEHPETPVRPRSRGLVLRVLLALIVGTLGALGLAAALEFVGLARVQ